MKRASRLLYLTWDLATITLGDYSIEYEITEKAYHHFLENIYPSDKARGDAPGESLKKYLKREIEAILQERLREELERQKDGDVTSSIHISEVKIADIVFAFNNAELINLLRERGRYIMY